MSVETDRKPGKNASADWLPFQKLHLAQWVDLANGFPPEAEQFVAANSEGLVMGAVQCEILKRGREGACPCFAALLGRFLPRLGPFPNPERPLFLPEPPLSAGRWLWYHGTAEKQSPNQNLSAGGIAMRTATGIAVILFGTAAAAQEVPPAPNGIELPQGYENWRIIAVSERTDNETLRAIMGNDAAIEAARAGETNPWPDGAVLAKIVWKQGSHENWDTALVPTEFVHAEFMVKDSSSFAETGGWGFARWIGAEQRPYGENAEFAQECFGCHTPVRENDYVFTRPAPMP